MTAAAGISPLAGAIGLWPSNLEVISSMRVHKMNAAKAVINP